MSQPAAPDAARAMSRQPSSSRPVSRETHSRAEQRPASRERGGQSEARPVSREPSARPEGTRPLSVVPDMPGRLTEAYDVQKAVGKGGYAVVYKGVRREDGRIIAVKKVEIFEMSQKKRDRCLQEVTLLSQLSHPNIIQMLDAFIDENMLIIIFEWAPAGDLKRLIRKTAEQGKSLDEPAIWNYFFQVADGLRYMHQHRIMHRDIKPANVLVGANGALKLGDLGLGRQLSEQTMEAFSKVGTPYYVSPEVVRGAGYDWKSDVWSMGCLLYELACLRSPFEMEGANLYDVFQKISKGDFPPLPADQFSAPLRSLASRMLQIDPAKRPELEEVWQITSGAVASQSKSRSDVHSTSMEAYEHLVILNCEVAARLASGAAASSSSATGATSATPSSSRPSSRQKGNAAPLTTQLALCPPPSLTIRSLHPLYFAEPLVPSLRPDADAFQKQQLGAFLHVFAWLLKLNGRGEAAAAVEACLEFVPARRVPTARAAGGGAAKDKSATLPLCNNILKGAEAAKRGAQALGLSTEFAPVNAIALGHGRAVCSLLGEACGPTLQRLPLACRPVVRHGERSGGGGADQDAEEVDEDPGALEGNQELVLSPEQQAAMQAGGGDDPGDDEAYYGTGSLLRGGVADAERAARSLSAGAAGTSKKGGAAAAARAGPAPVVQATAVDPTAWRLELERLAPQLSRIKMPAEMVIGDWSTRWTAFKAGAQKVSEAGPPAATALQKLRSAVESDLDRVGFAEQRLNGECQDLLARYVTARQRLQAAQRERDHLDELLGLGHAALSELTERQQEVQQSIQDRADGLDGSRQVKAIHDAMRGLRKELRAMDVRMGVVQQQLMNKQRERLGMGFVEAAAAGPGAPY